MFPHQNPARIYVSHSPLKNTLTILDEKYKFLHPLTPSSLFGTNIFVSTLYSKILNLCSFLYVSHHNCIKKISRSRHILVISFKDALHYVVVE